MSANLKHVRCFECNWCADAELKVLMQCGWTNREDGAWRCPSCSTTPSPTWSTTPPTEPGWYWSEVDHGEGRWSVWRRAPREIIEDDGVLYQINGSGDPRDVTELSTRGWRWWPVPIPVPPTTGKDGAA
jgi:hypothetical protein